MTLERGHLSLVSSAAPSHAASVDGIGSSPPAEALEAVDRAAAAAERLASENRELHFEKDPDSGRIIVQVRDLDGNVIETIPARDALDLLS